MSIPLKWAPGDRCFVRGQIGTVEGISDACASVRLNEWWMIFCGLDELELVPLETPASERETLPAPPMTTQEEPAHPSDAAPSQGEAAGRSGDTTYSAFVSRKLTRVPATGLRNTPALHARLFSFQRDLVGWALRRGRAALFADTGLGKTSMQLEWAKHVAEHTRAPVLILAPLAVAAQTAAEGAKLGIPVNVCRTKDDVQFGVNITNYDRMHRFDPLVFGGVVLDESSIIKHHDAKTLATMLDAFRDTPFKLAATATPSPNDYTELGTHAEFLGVCTRAEMLAEYFVHDGSSTQDWRLKGHARAHFWRWVATWAALLRKPSDLGYSDEGYDLPPLEVTQHTIAAGVAELNKSVVGQTSLFAEPAKTLTERRAARRGSLSERVRRLVDLITQGCDQCRPKSDALTTESGIDGTKSASEPIEKPRENSATLADESGTPPTKRTASSRKRKPASIASSTHGEHSNKTFDSSGSRSTATNDCLPSKAEDAPSASESATSTLIDASTSTTATEPARFAGSFAPRAISGSASSPTTPSVSKWPRGTCGCPASEQWVVWCELNDEEEEIMRSLGREATAVRGSDEPLAKEGAAIAFQRGDVRIIVSKPSIFGWGLNWQHAARMAFVGVKDSWESYYQSIRRCWRFGQKRHVHVHVFASELEGAVVENLRRKEADALAMAEQLGAETREAVRAEVRGSKRDTNDYAPSVAMTRPAWLERESA